MLDKLDDVWNKERVFRDILRGSGGDLERTGVRHLMGIVGMWWLD